MSDIRSATRDSSALLRIYIEEAQRVRHRVKQTAKFSTVGRVVYVPPVEPCVCRACEAPKAA